MLGSFDPVSFNFNILKVFYNNEIVVDGNPVDEKIQYHVKSFVSRICVPGIAFVLLGKELVNEDLVDKHLPIIICVTHKEAAVVWTKNDKMLAVEVSYVSAIRPILHGPGKYVCSVGTKVVAKILVDEEFNLSSLDIASETVSLKEEICGLLDMPGSLPSNNLDERKNWSPIAANDLVIGKVFKEGGMSTVHRATYLGTSVAAKKIVINASRKTRAIGVIENELTVHSSIHCDIIVQLVGYCQPTDSFGYIVTEFIAGPDMDELIFVKKNQTIYDELTKTEKNKIASDMVRSITYLHGQVPQIIHQDIKPGNFVLRLSDKSAKLIDLGLGKVRQMKTTGQTAWPNAADGTLSYIPPEKLLQNKDSTASGDIWSLGACLAEFLTGVEIWVVPDDEDEWEFLSENLNKKECPNALKKLKSLKHEHYNIIESTMHYNESERPKAIELCTYFSQ